MLTGDPTGALNDLGDVSFNVGGVSYDTTSAEAAIERLRNPAESRSPISRTSRLSTPKSSRPGKDHSEDHRSDRGTPASSLKSTDTAKDLPIDKLEEYFQSLMKGSGGSGSRNVTPSKKLEGE